MPLRAEVPEAQIAALGDPERIRRHYAEAFRVDELFALADEADRLGDGWSRLPAAERSRVLAERPDVISRGDVLTASPISSPLLTDWAEKARARWREARARFERLASS